MSTLQAASGGETERVTETDDGDSLTVGLFSNATLSALQKSIGMLRHVLFLCWLTQDQMGRFSVAQNLMSTIAPLILLGLPATLCRYVEQYRRLGQLRSYLRRISIACFVLPMPVIGLGIVFPHWFAEWIYRDPGSSELVRVLSIVLATVLFATTVNELLLAHRMFRVAAFMQFAGTVVFLGAGTLMMAMSSLRDCAVLIAFGLGNLTIAFGGLARFWPRWESCRDTQSAQAPSLFWRKLLGFSLWNSFSGTLAGLFFFVTNRAIIYSDGLTPREAEGLIGQLASGIFVPLQLMYFVLGLVGTTLFPYMSRDWERGLEETVGRRFHLAYKIMMLAFCIGALGVLLLSPILFDSVFHGRYNEGRELLPEALTLYAWMTATFFSQYYVLCAERPRAVCLALAVGVLVDGVIASALVPVYQLQGALIALTVGHLCSLIAMLYSCRKNGMPCNRSLLVASLLPIGLFFGALPALVMLVVVIPLLARGSWFFSDDEKAFLLDEIQKILARVFPESRKRFPWFRLVTRT